MYSCGRNKHGELGKPSPPQSSFTEVTELRGKQVKSITCGEDFTILSTSKYNKQYNTKGDGTLWSFGRNDFFQLGNPQPGAWKIGPSKPLRLAAGWGHVLVAMDDGVYSWGSNLHGQCGIGIKSSFEKPKKLKFNSKVEEIACGSVSSVDIFCNSNLDPFNDSF